MSPTPSDTAVRTLPEKHNPLILEEASPDHDELLLRRRLGKTNLSVKAGQIGTTNATKPENLGVFEYAHLRAPLPKDLGGSEIFAQHQGQKHTETYFLMRRSKDGFVSATGMFKIAFPWATIAEEKAERNYLKSMPNTSQDEVANNVWVSPELALELAKEYKMANWVRALLDSSEIVQTPASDKKLISPPPKFEMPPLDAAALLPPPSAKGGRSRRSASPSKIATPKKSGANPRKGRQTKAMKEANAAAATAANASLQSALDSAASAASSEEKAEEEVTTNGEHAEEATNGVEKAEEETEEDNQEKVKVDVQTTVDNTEHIEKTDVSVEIPAGLPEMPLPEDTENMISKAKEMVSEANKLQEAEASSSSPKESKKRKPDESVEDGESVDTPAQPAKKAKVLEDRLRRERVRNRALVGVTAALGLAAAVPYFF